MKIYRPHSSSPMSSKQISDWANSIAVNIGMAKNLPFTEGDFSGLKNRLNGFHCYCGTEDGTSNSPSLGEFELLSPTDVAVQDGMKAYMRCRKCGAFSHL